MGRIKKERTSKKCQTCGNIFEIRLTPSSRPGYGKYCSRTCYYESKNYHLSIKCLSCGKEFHITPGKEKERKYCSRQCSYKGRKQHIEIICQLCGKTFEITKCGKNRKYCSKKCYYADPNRILLKNGSSHPNWKGRRTNKLCLICKKEFEVFFYGKNQKFCSQKCYGEYRRTRVTKQCLSCGKQFTIPSAENKKKGRGQYCSKPCYFQAIRDGKIENSGCFKKGVHNNVRENNPMWIDGSSYEPYSFEFNKNLKEQIRKLDNYICQLCSKQQEEELLNYHRKLSIHHIDYNKKNNKYDNLITLCGHCNIIVNQNRPFWTVYFQAIVYERNYANQVYESSYIS